MATPANPSKMGDPIPNEAVLTVDWMRAGAKTPVGAVEIPVLLCADFVDAAIDVYFEPEVLDGRIRVQGAHISR